ncbi:MAG: signal peptidase II, partial [Lachnospiraceae bacterium]|nr:signal peptidase II [Lachnospiraceae bacterium]
KAGLALLLGGAYSNTYDRLTRKYVVDYVSFPVKNRRIRRIVFNISDFCIMIGALLLVLGETRRK